LTGELGDTRITNLPPLWQTARAFFPWGSGFGSFDSVYRHFEPRALLSTIYMNQAHNEPLQLLIEGGAPAIVLLLLFAGWWVRTPGSALFVAEIPGRRAMGVAGVATSIILMLSSLVDYPLRTPLLAGVFVFAWVEMMAAVPVWERGRGGRQRPAS